MTNDTVRKVLRLAGAVLFAPVAAFAAGPHQPEIERQEWSFSGLTGHYEPAQLRRGFQVYQQVCSSCHGLKRVAFRNLVEPGGPEFPEEAVKALAAEWPNKPQVVNDAGELADRTPTLADRMLGPYRNDQAARAAQNGAVPPDLSVIAKARTVETDSPFYIQPFLMIRDMATGYQEGGSDYLHALMTGYRDPPEGFQLAEGMYYNAVYPGHQIAMPPPIASESFVTYQDGSGSLEQNVKDVTAFLAWAADPHLNARKQLGWQVLLYLLVTTVLLFLAKRVIWRDAH